MLGVLEPGFHTIPYHSIPCHEFSEALFWGTWIVGDLGWQPSWGRILGEETPNRDKYGAVAGLQWCSGGRCQSHLFEAPPANDSPGDVCWLCVRLMPWRWWIFRPKCGSIPFGIQRLINFRHESKPPQMAGVLGCLHANACTSQRRSEKDYICLAAY